MIELEINFAQFGVIEDNGQVWANAQMVTDFVFDVNKAGCMFGTIPILTDNNNAVAKRLVEELKREGGPVKIIAQVGNKSVKGKISSIIKDFKLVEQKAPLANRPTGV